MVPDTPNQKRRPLPNLMSSRWPQSWRRLEPIAPSDSESIPRRPAMPGATAMSEKPRQVMTVVDPARARSRAGR